MTGNYLAFSVQACHSAMVALSSVPGSITYPAYVITLGVSNSLTASITRPDTGLNDTFQMSKMLDCYVAQEFWVHWENTPDMKMEFGYGIEVLQNEIGRIEVNESFTVHGISVATDGTDGHWQVHQDAGTFSISYINISIIRQCLLHHKNVLNVAYADHIPFLF